MLQINFAASKIHLLVIQRYQNLEVADLVSRFITNFPKYLVLNLSIDL